ncbi:hypothetical protein PLANPX_3448 [Lacipirellula parvula]|uniref:Glycoside hydrolase family 42 N-terminal domain-containing protein n=2 Tax=Lacipirellula parvula TaxID=2650471 RepID=A0A5K7XHS7_9BACT|nr:hypothetical protein PLANPX_3448 [Lacipirellula parvula]
MKQLFACAVLAIGSLVALSPLSAVAQVRQPVGYFVMQEVGSQNIKDVKLASPAFTGIVIRERWSSLNPAPGVYNWKFLDGQTARARRLGKAYILAIYTGNNAPLWLGVPLFKSAPLPWDSKMLAAHGQMVAMLGQRYGRDANLVGVELSGPTRGPSGSLEMHLADGLLQHPSYRPENVALAWMQCINQYGAAFPQCGLISDGGIAPGGKDGSITQAVFNHLYQTYPMQANVSHCALKANTQESAPHHAIVVAMARRGCSVGFEMVGPSVAGVNGEGGPVARFSGDFDSALAIANRAGASWLKIYQGDEFNAMD